VTKAEAQNVRLQLARGHNVAEWMVTETLDNRLLAWRPREMQRVWLLDDANDGPKGDWELDVVWDQGCGMPLETYMAMANWADGRLSGSPADCAGLCSRAFSAIERGGFLLRPQELAALLRRTIIHFMDGTTAEYEAERDNLVSVAEELDEEPAPDFIEISGSGNDFETFYPTSTLRMIDMPLIELEASRRELLGDHEEVR
jgi:hypothetical protein